MVEHLGAPAVVSAEVRGEEDFSRKYWWIIELVARALALAAEIASHSERLSGTSGSPRRRWAMRGTS